MSPEDKLKLDKIRDYLHLAWCVDGTVEWVGPMQLPLNITDNNITDGGVFKITDKFRGEFYVGIFQKIKQ